MSELTTLGQGDAPRFRPAQDWFVLERREHITCITVGTTSERVVDLWHALSVSLEPAVDVHVHDVRTGREWDGALLALPEVREAMGRLRLPLAAYGGVEFSVYTGDDQLTLTPEMLLTIYARTDRWSYLLDGMGLVERKSAPSASWSPSRATLRPEPQLEQALLSAAERLDLVERAGS